MRFLPILCLSLLPSCIAAQLAETEAHILGALEDHRDATFETYEAYQSGVITQDELEEELDEIREERDQSVERAWENLTDHVESEIQRVKATATTAAGGILGGGPLVDLLAAIGTSIAGGAYTTNRMRDGRRRMRGEPTSANTPT
jgi:histidinol dehydrogenase